MEIAPRTLIHAANYWERRIPENEEYIQLAIKYYQKAAELGEAYGYECLGKVYFNIGDYGKAYESLTKIKVRNACGCYYLARLYDEGLAVNEDKQKAIELYKKTVRLGYVGRKLVDIDAIEAKKRLRELG